METSGSNKPQFDEENNNEDEEEDVDDDDENQERVNEVKSLNSDSANKLIDQFMRNRSSGDENNFWSEEGDESDQVIPMMRSKDTVNHFLKTAKQQQLNPIGEHSILSKEGGGSIKRSTPTTPSSCSSSRRPDLGFLENDVGLWDAFFLHEKNSAKYASVLPPYDDYLRKRKSVTSPVTDADSLRLLLPPSAQKHVGPVQQVCMSMSRLGLHDATNEVIKSMTEPVKVVKVKEAWAAVPEVATPTTTSADWSTGIDQDQSNGVVKRRVKNRSQQNLNLINNNNNNSNSEEDSGKKRRSYHPTEYLSNVLTTTQRKSRRSAEGFPKVRTGLKLILLIIKTDYFFYQNNNRMFK